MKTLKALMLVAAIVVVGCTTTKLVEDPPGSGTFKKVVEVDPRFTEVIETSGAVNDATLDINPYHGLVTILLGASTAVAGWVAKRKNDELNAVKKSR